MKVGRGPQFCVFIKFTNNLLKNGIGDNTHFGPQRTKNQFDFCYINFFFWGACFLFSLSQVSGAEKKKNQLCIYCKSERVVLCFVCEAGRRAISLAHMIAPFRWNVCSSFEAVFRKILHIVCSFSITMLMLLK